MPEQPGWYPDPAKPDSARWWDGSGWTQHVRAGTPPPAPPVQTEAATRTVPGWAPPQPAPSPYPEPSRGNVLTRSSLSVASMVFTALLVAAVLGGAVVWLGLLPIVLAVVGYKLHERLAVPALIVAALGLVINVIVVGTS